RRDHRPVGVLRARLRGGGRPGCGVDGSEVALMSLEFLIPSRLWWLLVVPAIGLLYLYLSSLRPRSRKRLTNLDRVLPRDKTWKRHLAVGMALLAIAALVVAYAKPKDFTEVPRERATVVV